MDGSVLYDSGQGAVFFQLTNTSLPEQQWQIFTFSSSTYVLRTKGSGPDGYLNVAASVNETTPGVSPWGDGNFYLTNAANGTAWHLEVKSNALMAMSSNITAPQDGQAFSFTELEAIDYQRFSTVNTPPATSMPTGTTTRANSPTSTSSSLTSTTTSSTSSTSSGSQGLSSGASTAIGASIGGVALIALLIIGYILLRRRKRRSSANVNELESPPKGPDLVDSQNPPLSGIAELQVPPPELPGDGLPAEPAELLGYT